MKEINKRTYLPSLYMYCQVIIVNTSIVGICVLQYIYYSQYYLFKLIFYCTFGPCFLLILIHVTFTLAIIQKKINIYLPKNNVYKLCIFGIAIIGGLLTYPIIIAMFDKGIWFMYFSMIGIIVQFALSYKYVTLPYKKYIMLYAVSLVFLCL